MCPWTACNSISETIKKDEPHQLRQTGILMIKTYIRVELSSEGESPKQVIERMRRIGDHVYGVDSYGELRCLYARTGDRVWESLAAVPRERWAISSAPRAFPAAAS